MPILDLGTTCVTEVDDENNVLSLTKNVLCESDTKNQTNFGGSVQSQLDKMSQELEKLRIVLMNHFVFGFPISTNWISNYMDIYSQVFWGVLDYGKLVRKNDELYTWKSDESIGEYSAK